MAGLTGKVVTSLGWVFANMVTKNFLQLVQTVVLWRILDAKDFGLQGMAWLAINAFTILQDMGFQSALIQRKTRIEEAVTVTWYANVVIRALVYLVLFVAAPFVSRDLGENQLTAIIRVASLAILINSFGSANEALLRKNFKFRKILVVDSIELFTQVASQVALALLGYGVWALVWGTIIAVAVRSLVLWWIAPIRLVRFHVDVAREMFHFGGHMTVSTLFIWLINNMDYYFVGKFLGTAALGYYTLAYRLAFRLAGNVARMLGAVLFPAFSEIGHDLGRVRDAWLRAIRYSMILMVPMALAMILFPRELIATLYLPKCDVVVGSLAILTVAALFRGVGTPLGDMQKGIGKPHFLTIVAFAHAVLMLPLLVVATYSIGRLDLPGSFGPLYRALLPGGLAPVELALAELLLDPALLRLGITSASLAVTLSTLVGGIGLALVLTAPIVGYTPGMVWRALMPALVSGCVMTFVGLGAKLALLAVAPGAPAFVRLGILVTIALAAFGLTLLVGFRSVTAELRTILARSRKKPADRAPGAPEAAATDA